jgi:AraC-like DNA-binding protein
LNAEHLGWNEHDPQHIDREAHAGEQLAEHAGQHDVPEQLETRMAGCAPGHFLLVLRMRSAARLLQAGNNVDNMAERVGYQSAAAFARAFKKHTGQQPGAYRRQARSALACQQLS